MKNKFYVTICRFHTKAENKLLITGWFYQNEMGDNQLLVCLDKKRLPVTIEETELERKDIKKREEILITKQYYLWVSLPKKWRECKCLEVKNFYHGVGNTAFSMPVSRLKEDKEKVKGYVDGGIIVEDGFQISGWYIDNGGIEFHAYDKSGSEYPLEFRSLNRDDVRKVYPENAEEEIVGFVASYKGSVPDKVRVCLRDTVNHLDREDTVILHPSLMRKGVVFAKKTYKKTLVYYQQFGVKATVFRAFDKIRGRDTLDYKIWYKRHKLSNETLKKQRKRKFNFLPKISIIVPLYKTPEKYLNELIESVKVQTYGNWELCLSDGSGKDSPIARLLKQYEAEDSRIKVVYHAEPLRISENTNEALKLSTGDYIAFADHDDLLAPNALYECVDILNRDLSTDIIYTDEDKVDMNGKEHFMPHFKPDFNIDMLRSVNYICHLFVVKREIYEVAGIMNPEFDGAQDYDFIFRCIEKTTNIRHIPKVLYHWRAHKESTAENPESKNYAFEAGKRAIQAHYDRLGIPAVVYDTENKGIYRSRYKATENPLISVIIPNKDHIEDLDTCICSLEEKNAYQNIEYIIVENNSEDEETFQYYQELEKKNPRAKVLFWKEKRFNFSAINNFGAEHASGDYLLFLNNDTEVINQDAIEELLRYCMREDVGAVGARLYFEDGTIQHAGVVIGLGGVAGHVFPGYPHDALGYFGRIVMAQDYSAVTAACMMVKKSVFFEVKGFDEGFAVAFNDIDLCLKIRKHGYLIVYNPYAELSHYESKSRGYEDTVEKIRRFNSEMDLFVKKWKRFLEQGDPYYNPNLTLDRCDFSLDVNVNKML